MLLLAESILLKGVGCLSVQVRRLFENQQNALDLARPARSHPGRGQERL